MYFFFFRLMIDTPLQSTLHAVLSFVRNYPSLMNLDLRNVFSDPRQVFADRRVPSVIFAVLHDETGNSMHGPRIIAVSAHQRAARIPPASVRIGYFAETDTNHFWVVSATHRWNHGHACLHQDVGSPSRMSSRAPTCNKGKLENRSYF